MWAGGAWHGPDKMATGAVVQWSDWLFSLPARLPAFRQDPHQHIPRFPNLNCNPELRP